MISFDEAVSTEAPKTFSSLLFPDRLRGQALD